MNEEQLRAQLAAVYASKSWRMTAPLRLSMGCLLRIRNWVTHPRQTIGNGLRRLARNPRVRRMGPLISLHFPKLYVRLLRIVNAEPDMAAIVAPVQFVASHPQSLPIAVILNDTSQAGMSAGARRIFVALNSASRSRQQ